MTKWTMLCAAGTLAVGLVVSVAAAPVAGADPNVPPPCPGMLASVCGMVPMMPELEQDIDLTQQNPPGTGLDAENLPPADVCAAGCI